MTNTQALLRRIAERAKAEPENILPALRVLAGESPFEASDDRVVAEAAFTEPDPVLWSTAAEINRPRLAQARAEFVAHAWPTERVAEHLGVKSRQAIAQRRARGTLLGAKIGGTTYYPTWQFSPEGLAVDLDRLLDLLRGQDAVSADNILRMPHSDLGGRAVADLFRAGEWDELEVWIGDIVGWRR